MIFEFLIAEWKCGPTNSPSFVVVKFPLLYASLVALGQVLQGSGGDVLGSRGRH